MIEFTNRRVKILFFHSPVTFYKIVCYNYYYRWKGIDINGKYTKIL